MQTQLEPTMEEWRSLYTLADQLRKISPWSFMGEEIVFGVKHPETGEVGYCGILGGLGEVFAFVVYEGEAGLSGIIRLLEEENGVSPDMIFETQHVLMASFENREDLDKKDLNIIRQLGLKFRGKKCWPMFRHYKPGFVPWFIDSAQAKFLALCLEQAIDVLPRYQKDPSLLSEATADHHFVRIRRKVSGKETWTDNTLPAPPTRMERPPDVPVDDVSIARLQRQGKTMSGTWEIGYLYAPMPIQETAGERPFFPRLMLVCETETGIILTFHMERDDTTPTRFRDHLLEFFTVYNYLPSRMYANHPITATIIRPICRKLGIDFEYCRSLPTVEFAVSEMFSV
ncbi:MAG TPA: hypothetical protein PLT64_08915 [Syntrophales bacterium]|nr:hypothetical protein [Syntrophales bacterium]HOL59963.1 hypothetical protein [Syntrophales bacterium]HPO36124.1 hypothetical protein [Syntrophales bacterium]